jgi:hypothetical protein
VRWNRNGNWLLSLLTLFSQIFWLTNVYSQLFGFTVLADNAPDEIQSMFDVVRLFYSLKAIGIYRWRFSNRSHHFSLRISMEPVLGRRQVSEKRCLWLTLLRILKICLVLQNCHILSKLIQGANKNQIF